jgi:hypothetical protein
MPVSKEGPLPLYIDDVVRLRKSHPCGSHEWKIYRLGADIGIRCEGCGRRVMIPRRELERRLTRFVSRPALPTDSPEDGVTGASGH